MWNLQNGTQDESQERGGKGLGKKIGRVKDILYVIKEKDLFVLNGERGGRWRNAEDDPRFDGLRIVEERMERTRDFMKMLMAEKIMRDEDRA